MFNSQKINNDPAPWVVASYARNGHAVTWRGMALDDDHAIEMAYAAHPQHEVHTYGYAPRTEFDNHASSVLEAFRNDCELQAPVLTVKRCAELWLERGISARIKRATWGEILHARKVLERLAAL